MTDTGRSHERTSLAWQRTALSLFVSCVAVVRVSWSSLGLGALVAIALGALLSACVFAESHARCGNPRTALCGNHRRPLGLTLGTALLAGAELLSVVLR